MYGAGDCAPPVTIVTTSGLVIDGTYIIPVSGSHAAPAQIVPTDRGRGTLVSGAEPDRSYSCKAGLRSSGTGARVAARDAFATANTLPRQHVPCGLWTSQAQRADWTSLDPLG